MNFLAAYQQLIKSSPAPALYGGRNEDTSYCDNVWHSSNTYYSFDGGRLRNSAYMHNCTGASYNVFCVDCFDCDHCNSCQRCYECFVAHNCYNSSYLEYCNRLSDSHFCTHCRNSSHLFGCAELEHKQYCIFNVQYSKEEYLKRVAFLHKRPAEEILDELRSITKNLPQPWMRVTRKSENSFGDYVLDCKNCYFCFFANECEDSAYLFDSNFSRDCFDGDGLHMCELCYECTNIGHSYNCSFILRGDYLTDCHFCSNCYNSQNLFGCVNLNKAKFCILNTQYSEEEYWNKLSSFGVPSAPRKISPKAA